MRWLLKLYPRAWRARYGAEMEEIVASQRRSLKLVIDLLGGAVDAHLNPTVRIAGELPAGGGGQDMLARLKCGAEIASPTRKDALFGAGLTLGSALLVAAMMVIGRSPITETIGLVMFPGVLAVGAMSTSLRHQSWPARAVLIGGLFLILFVIGWVAAVVRQ